MVTPFTHAAILIPTMSLGWVWLIVALLFLVAELATPGLFFFISFSVGACAASFGAFWGISVQAQCILGLLVSLIALVIMRRFFESGMKLESPKTNMEALIGHCGVVTQTITLTKSGRVKFRGEEWPARMRHGFELAVGEPVRIIGIEGNHVLVILHEQ